MNVRANRAASMGSTGYQPVPRGNLPRGTEDAVKLLRRSSATSGSPTFRPAGSRAERAGSPFHPTMGKRSSL